MTWEEILREAKPILFSTEMVKAILDDRKTVTRRVVKQNTEAILHSQARVDHPELSEAHFINKLCMAPYYPGDYLYVRETWQYAYDSDGNGRLAEETGRYVYAADNPNPFNCWIMPDGTERDTMPWRPSIHMPKEAARLFLRVKDVRAERLQDITVEQAILEGETGVKYDAITGEELSAALDWFPITWNHTVKKANLYLYGWEANPWVWVIEFERVVPE